jgi:TRAP-type C4-dicarboxylate transport system permease small subunit
MSFTSGIAQLRKLSYKLSDWLELVAAWALVGMLVATCVDVVGAKLFLWPLPGGYEAVSLLQVVAIASGLAFAKIEGMHIRVEMVVNILPKRIQQVINSVVSLLGLGLFVLLGWKSIEYGLEFLRSGKVTSTAQFPFFPFALWVAVCCIPICLLLLIDLFNSLQKAVSK